MTMNDQNETDDALAPETPTDVPEWATLPPDLKIPSGRVVAFLRFRAEWTDTPNKGERHCIVWNLTDGEERVSLKRAAGAEAMLVATELAKQTVRSVDGVRTNWGAPKGPGSIDQFWSEIGSRCRNMVIRWYSQNHMLNEVEQRDFFENCVVVRTMG